MGKSMLEHIVSVTYLLHRLPSLVPPLWYLDRKQIQIIYIAIFFCVD
jgi:hypothetical protein